MGKVNITFPGNLGQVEAVADLRSVPSYFLPEGLIYIVKLAKRSFVFDTGATGADDGLNVIKPNDLTAAQAGRWVYAIDGIAPGAQGPAGLPENTYDSYAELQASDPTLAYANLANDKDTPPHPNGAYYNPTQTVGGWVPQQADGVAYGQQVNIALPLDRSIPRTLAYMAGVDPFTTASQQSKLESAFSSAAAEGFKLLGHPDAQYRHDGPLPVSTSFDGQGATFRALSNGFQNIAVSGANVRLANFTHLGGATARGNGDNRLNGLTGENATNLLIENVEIGSPGVDGSGTQLGFAAAGMLFVNCDGVVLWHPRVLYTLADAIHFTRNSKNAEIYNPYVYRSGDDGLALAVSYTADPGIVENIRSFGGRFVECKARAVSIVGGRNCHAFGAVAERTSAAAFYIASEAGTFNTHGVMDSTMRGVMAKDCVTGVGLDSNFSNAVFLMAGQPGTANVDGTPMSRAVVDCSIEGTIKGTGARAPSAINNANPYVVRSRIDANIASATGTVFQPVALSIGGESCEADVSVQTCGGPLLTMPSGGSASGKHRVRIRPSSGINTQNNAINTSIYTESAPNLQEFLIDGAIIDNAPTTPIIDVGGVAGRTRYNRFWLNGALLAGKDYVTGTLTYSQGWSGGSLTRDATGRVAITGTFTAGTTSGLVATLPTGYRPLTDQRVAVVNTANGSIGSVVIYATGEIGIIAGVTGSFGISAQYMGA